MNHELTIGHEDQMAIVLGQRQLMAVCCMFLVVLGLVSTLSYVAGRSITAAQFRNSERAENSAPAQPVVIDPTRRQARTQPAAEPVPASEPVEAQALPEAPVPAPKPSPFGDSVPAAAAEGPKAAALDPGALTEPAAGTVFFQVGSVDRAKAPEYGAYLAGQGLRIRLAPGISPALVRVLVGPLANDREIQEANNALDAGGFEHFLRRY